jgi:hypothetical protein
VLHLTPTQAYPAPAGFVAVAYSESHDALPVATVSEPVTPHRVLKDTIILRVEAAGKLADLMALHASLPALQRWQFDQAHWFSSDNALILGGLAQLNLNTAVILAVDPLAP